MRRVNACIGIRKEISTCTRCSEGSSRWDGQAGESDNHA